MKYIINIILLLLILALGYFLIQSIHEPINFKAIKDTREKAVQGKLEKIRTAQQCFHDITGVYAHDFDTLKQVLSTDSFKIVRVFGDPDDPTGQKVKYETSYANALDSIQKLGIDLSDISKIPYGDGKEFDVKARKIVYQSITVPVVKVKAAYKDFMGEYSHPRYKSYDKFYNPDDPTEDRYYLSIGDLNRPSLGGSW